jgi:hypothetical protein
MTNAQEPAAGAPGTETGQWNSLMPGQLACLPAH